MTHIEYNLLREQERHLGLPEWYELRHSDVQRLVKMSRDEVIAGRTAVLLAAPMERWSRVGFQFLPPGR